jgi:hypothetical protein
MLNDLPIVSIGVALQLDPDEGVAGLRAFGEFDQLCTGSVWANQVAISFFELGLPPVHQVPQVVVYYRRLEVHNSVITIADRQLLGRRAGLNEIAAWTEAGVVLPRPSSTMITVH